MFKNRNPSWIDPAVTGTDFQLQTRLWSLHPTLFDETLAIFSSIVENMFSTIRSGKYIDIEHSMAKFIPAEKLIELAFVGVSGNIAPNGALVIE